jgi:hypothetical protein
MAEDAGAPAETTAAAPLIVEVDVDEADSSYGGDA